MLHENIKKLRRILGLSEYEFGKLFNKSYYTVRKWEEGKTRKPRPVDLLRMAELAGIPLVEFIRNELK